MNIDSHLLKYDFNRSPYVPHPYLRQHGGDIVIVVVYVDDLVITGSIEELIISCKDDLKWSFNMIELSLLHYFLRLEVWKMQDQIFISQMKYTNNLLEKFRMIECDPMSTPIKPSLHFSCHNCGILCRLCNMLGLCCNIYNMLFWEPYLFIIFSFIYIVLMIHYFMHVILYHKPNYEMKS